MKKFFTALCALAIIACSMLFVQCKNAGQQSVNVANSNDSAFIGNGQQRRIAYINTDTLLQKYNYAQDLQKKAKKACLTEAALVRLLLRGYEPREKPDERFYDAMRELSAIGNNINQLAIKANALGFVDSQMLKNEALRWHKFQAAIEREFLRPEKSGLKWQ